MERLWAPWRMQYIQAIDKQEDGCIFCTKPKQDTDRDNLILWRGEHCFVIMNRYPYSNGHLLIVPYQHTSHIEDIDDTISSELWKTMARCVAILGKKFKAEGFNIGLNLGRLAGAGIDQHVHLHIVPRWNGDTNFMPVVADTRVISQGLLDAYDALLPEFKA
jgi:ATP adenylyltransferase